MQFMQQETRTYSEMLEDRAWARLAKSPHWCVTPELLFAVKDSLREEDRLVDCVLESTG